MTNGPASATCWCGSGLTYAACHQARELLPPLSYNEVIERVDRSRFRLEEQTCMFGACAERPIGSHGIQRAALRRIADSKGRVLAIESTFPQMPDPPLKPQAASKATRFPGFCATHDNDLFAPIEDQAWRGTREQCLRVTYRALCAEIWKMGWKVRHQLPAMRELDRGRGPDVQKALQDHCDTDEFGARAALWRYGVEKEVCEDLIRHKDFTTIEAYTVEFATPIPVASQRALLTKLEVDHDARTVEVRLGSFALLPLPDGGRVVVAWRGAEEPDIARTLASLSDANVALSLLEFVLTFSEDTFLSQTWYGSLGHSEQAAVHGMMRSKPRSSGFTLAHLPATKWEVRTRGRIDS